MTATHELHRACVVARKYPTTTFWVLACTAFAAGLAANAIVLGAALIAMLSIMAHTARQAWMPPIRMRVGNRRDGDGRHAKPGD